MNSRSGMMMIGISRASNRKRPDKTADPNNPEQLIITVPYSLAVRSVKHLKMASKLVMYYDLVAIPLMAANIKCNGK